MKEKKELEMRAEEMRILYVAMTRAKEHLEIIASVKDIEREIGKWQDAQLGRSDIDAAGIYTFTCKWLLRLDWTGSCKTS